MSRKDRLIRQWIASGDLPPEALGGGAVPGYQFGHGAIGGSTSGTGTALAEGFAPEFDMAGAPYGTREPDRAQARQRPARRSSRALPLLVGLGVVVWVALAGTILYMKYQGG